MLDNLVLLSHTVSFKACTRTKHGLQTSMLVLHVTRWTDTCHRSCLARNSKAFEILLPLPNILSRKKAEFTLSQDELDSIILINRFNNYDFGRINKRWVPSNCNVDGQRPVIFNRWKAKLYKYQCWYKKWVLRFSCPPFNSLVPTRTSTNSGKTSSICCSFPIWLLQWHVVDSLCDTWLFF